MAIENFYYSMSKVRTFFSGGCTYRFHLKYQLGHKEKVSSAALLGKVAHVMLQQAYAGIALAEAHRRIWKDLCGPLLPELERWYALDEAYRASGKARTKARQLWGEQHPQYLEMSHEIEAYKSEYLSEDYTWARSAQLSDYYRWSCEFSQVNPARLLHPNPFLVEGLSVRDVDGRLIERFHAEGGTQESYRLLFGDLDGFPVAGVPDLFAVGDDGIAWVADYKVMNRPMTEATLSEDSQLALYTELLRQNGYIGLGQRVMIGHIYLTNHIAEEDGVQTVWTLPSPNVLPRLVQQLAYMDRHIQQDDFVPVRGIATGVQVPCQSCGLASACPTYQAHDVPVFSEDDEEASQ